MRILILIGICLSGGFARAQNITVQQPVIGTFGVNTTVSVPDRGGAYLGGVSQRAAARNSFGPLWSGTSWGEAASAQGASVRVWIHDTPTLDNAVYQAFENQLRATPAMDREALARQILQTRSRQMDFSTLQSRRNVLDRGTP